MMHQVRRLAEQFHSNEDDGDSSHARLATLWTAASQLLLATGAAATLEQLASRQGGEETAPDGLTWAPLLLGPLAAAAHLEHARRPTERTRVAVRFLTGASIGVGTLLFAVDSIVNREHLPRRAGSLAFASAGLLGLLLERQQREVEAAEQALEQRARIVERLVPRRKAKLDRIVVHV